MDIIDSDLVWVLTIATFLAVVLISILGLYMSEAVRRNWRRGRESHRFLDRRHSQRFEVTLPVFVYGHASNAEPFSEQATALQVSAHGGLLTLATDVRVGQELLLESNDAPDLRQKCWVARLGSSNRFRTQVAVKFARPRPEFWLTQAR
jgi:hypothetical protein